MRSRLQPGPAPRATRFWLGVALALLALAGGASLRASEVIDRIVATVDHHAILQSEWDEAVRFECLMEGRPLEQVTDKDRRKTLERLIDQSLVEGQMEASSYVRAGSAEVARRLQEIRSQSPAWSSEEGWRATLERYGLNEEDVASRVALQMDVLSFIDQRFRPTIRIDRRSIEEYYLKQFLPQLRRAGAAEAPLRQVSPQIEEVLVQQRIDELQAAWLQNLRSQSEVQVR